MHSLYSRHGILGRLRCCAAPAAASQPGRGKLLVVLLRRRWAAGEGTHAGRAEAPHAVGERAQVSSSSCSRPGLHVRPQRDTQGRPGEGRLVRQWDEGRRVLQ